MKKVRVLYVEDEPFLGRIVKESLESRSFEVIMINDGKEVVKAFTLHSPDICVLDVMLPHQDGFTLADHIKKLNSAIPIIFVTAKTQTEDVIKGFESGGNDYLRKPFSMEELIVRINNLLSITRTREEIKQEVITIGSFQFHVNRYELRRQSATRKLSSREAMLLLILCENLNKTASRKDILLRVWGDDSFFNSRTLDVYIAKLRDMFKVDPAIEIITIKGVGYHFVVS